MKYLMPLVPILPSNNFYLRASGYPDDYRFAAIFRDTWRKLPRKARRAIVRHGRVGQAIEDAYFGRGPSPYIAIEQRWDGRLEGDLGHMNPDRGSLHFWKPAINIMPESLISVLIARQLRYLYLMAQGYGGGQEDYCDYEMMVRRQTESEWGFEETEFDTWLQVNSRELKRLENQFRGHGR